jgi:pilus assembly protein CpaE
MDMKPDVIIPHAPSVFGAALNNGQMIGEVNSKHKSAESLRELALIVSGRQPQQKAKKSLLGQLGLQSKAKAKAK